MQTTPAGVSQRGSCVTLPAAPVMLAPRHDSIASVLHPLPSVPITGNAALGAATPSLGAWSPHQPRQPAAAGATAPTQTAASTAHTATPAAAAAAAQAPSSVLTAIEQSKTGVWADLAAELKSAPISMPQLAEPDSILLQASDAAASAATSATGPASTSSPAGQDQPSLTLPKSAKKAQPSRIRRKLIAETTAAPPQGFTEAMQDGRQQPDLDLDNATGDNDFVQSKPTAAKALRARGKGTAVKAATNSQAQGDPAAAASQHGTSKATASADVTSVTEAQQAVMAPAAAAKAPLQAAKGPADRAKKGNFRGTGVPLH